MRIDCRWLGACLLPLMAGCAEPIAAKAEAEDVPVVRQAECRWATDRISIDGILDEKAWVKAQKMTEFAMYWKKSKPTMATTARLLWDNQYLYFCAEMEDLDLFAIEREANGETWEDDAFTLFLKPSEKGRAYYEFQVNARNTPLELYLPSRGAGGYRRFSLEGALGMESAVKLRGTL